LKRLALVFFLAIPSCLFSQTKEPIYVEAIPDQVQARLEVRARAAANAEHKGGAFGVQYFMFYGKRWPEASSKPITVAFNGGTEELDSKIAHVASEWSNYGNVKFDFTDPATGHYRQWSRTDTAFKADIRIAFDGVDGPGYWSLVGTDSSDATLIAPNQASLELQGFASQLPPDWAGTVRHEFGHALGLMHEHQMPVGGCDQDFKWEDDPGYTPTQDINGQYVNDTKGRHPGIYTLLAGYPNYWPADKVKSNMRQLTIDYHNYDYGAFDPMSIMKYYFDPSYFVSGTAAHCYSDKNNEISPVDQSGIHKWYPSADSNDLQQIFKEQSSFMQSLKTLENLRNIEGAK
jgi:hypothetical protein